MGKWSGFRKKIENWGQSVKLWGNCDHVIVIDADYGATPDSNNNLNVISSVYEVPEDLRYDVYGVKVWALPPHIGKPKPPTKWEKSCYFRMFEFEEWQGYMTYESTSGCGASRISLGSYYGDRLQSFELSPGCKEIKLWDDDGYGDNSGYGDEYFSSSQGSLNNDLSGDVRAVTLWPKNDEQMRPC